MIGAAEPSIFKARYGLVEIFLYPKFDGIKIQV